MVGRGGRRGRETGTEHSVAPTARRFRYGAANDGGAYSTARGEDLSDPTASGLLQPGLGAQAQGVEADEPVASVWL